MVFAELNERQAMKIEKIVPAQPEYRMIVTRDEFLVLFAAISASNGGSRHEALKLDNLMGVLEFDKNCNLGSNIYHEMKRKIYQL